MTQPPQNQAHAPTFLIAPDSFKGSLSATEFCAIAQRVIKDRLPNATVISRPMSDGGEGFVDAFLAANVTQPFETYSPHSLWVANPLGRKVKARFAWAPHTQTAIIEMAQASGLTKLRPPELNPMQTHTYGTGQLINAALNLGAKKIVLGLGGSATNDGGAAALQALGIELFDIKGQPIGLGAQALRQLHRIGDIPAHLTHIDWLIACDVTNPLLGQHGATRVFAPQKGAQPQQMDALEHALSHFADCIQTKTGVATHDLAGAGAAGGMAAGFMGLLNARMQPGFEVLNQTLNLNALFAQHRIDYLITGEGKIDTQTQYGKLPLRLAQLAKAHSPAPITIGVCGAIDLSAHSSTHAPTNPLSAFDALFSITPQPIDLISALQNAPINLQNTLHAIVNLLALSTQKPS
ncbi:glycerate kinase [Thiomicrorhabdus aquaedulcis]|uniref:glycerate kinase n=1 Tax=Thiomicrorhabdus aquaedulcis TaxID=2211106 RepID=UPI000FDC4A82|nr:glycerate kinase [Thiomicrorhabdus aquaedulcis]